MYLKKNVSNHVPIDSFRRVHFANFTFLYRLLDNSATTGYLPSTIVLKGKSKKTTQWLTTKTFAAKTTTATSTVKTAVVKAISTTTVPFMIYNHWIIFVKPVTWRFVPTV